MSTVNPVNPAPLNDGITVGNPKSSVNATSWRNWFSQLVTSFNALAQYINLATNVTQVTATPPVVSSGGPAPVISMPAATDWQNGYLTLTDHQALSAAVPNTRQVNGKALSSNITLGLASADFANQGSVNTVLHGNAAGNPAFSAVVEADMTLAANTTNDVSVTKHGFAPQAPNDVTKFLRGDATWATSASPGETFLTSAFNVSAGATGTQTITFANTYGANPKIALGYVDGVDTTTRYSENFEEYTVGTSLIGAGDQQWTVRETTVSSWQVVAGKYGELHGSSVDVEVSCNASALASLGDQTIDFDVASCPSYVVVFGFHVNSGGGYWIEVSQVLGRFRLYSGTAWSRNFGVGTLLANWDVYAPAADVEHIKITVVGNVITVKLASDAPHTYTDASNLHPTGTISMHGYAYYSYTSWGIDNIVITSNAPGTFKVCPFISALSTTQATVGIQNVDASAAATGRLCGIVSP